MSRIDAEIRFTVSSEMIRLRDSAWRTEIPEGRWKVLDPMPASRAAWVNAFRPSASWLHLQTLATPIASTIKVADE